MTSPKLTAWERCSMSRRNPASSRESRPSSAKHLPTTSCQAKRMPKSANEALVDTTKPRKENSETMPLALSRMFILPSCSWMNASTSSMVASCWRLSETEVLVLASCGLLQGVSNLYRCTFFPGSTSTIYSDYSLMNAYFEAEVPVFLLMLPSCGAFEAQAIWTVKLCIRRQLNLPPRLVANEHGSASSKARDSSDICNTHTQQNTGT